jgi:hypothetical protein
MKSILISTGLLGCILAQTSGLCSGQMTAGKLVNPGFEKNTCGFDWCKFNAENYQNQVDGWIPSPTM